MTRKTALTAAGRIRVSRKLARQLARQLAKSFDFTVANEGSIFLVTPQTRAAEAWLDESVDTTEAQYFGDALVVDQHYIADLLDGIGRAGFTVADRYGRPQHQERA